MSRTFENTRSSSPMMVTWLEHAYEVLKVTFEDNGRKEVLLRAAWIYYGRPLTSGQLAMFLEDLEDYSSQAIDAAIGIYQRQPNPSLANPRPPYPADLIGHIDPQPTEAERSVELANEVFRMVRRVGRPGATRARDQLSAAAYATAMESRGGWEAVCASFGEPGLVGTVMAQLKATAGSVLARHRREHQRALMAPHRQQLAAAVPAALAPARAHAALGPAGQSKAAEAVVEVIEKLSQKRTLV